MRIIPRHILNLLLILPLLAGCQTVPSPRPERTAVTLKELCDQHHVQWHWDSVSQVVTLKYGSREARALIGSDLVIVGADKIALGGPLIRYRNAIYVPEDFQQRIIRRLTEKTMAQGGGGPVAARPYRIILDPGHGGKDPGTTGRTGVKEKTIVLDISRRLKKDLEAQGIEVILTRDRDIFISLAERTEIVSRKHPDLFVSIHANSSPVRSVEGVEVFTSPNKTTRNDAEQLEKNKRLLLGNLSMDRRNANLEEVLMDMLERYKDIESPVVAGYVAQGTAAGAQTQNRGTKQSEFFVLRNNLIPAVLVEVGFLSNSEEERRLDNASYRQQIADGLSRSIIEYLHRR